MTRRTHAPNLSFQTVCEHSMYMRVRASMHARVHLMGRLNLNHRHAPSSAVPAFMSHPSPVRDSGPSLMFCMKALASALIMATVVKCMKLCVRYKFLVSALVVVRCMPQCSATRCDAVQMRACASVQVLYN